MKNRILALVGSMIVIIHTLINLAHGAAHRDLGIQLVPWQNVFVMLAFVIGPIVAAILLWTSSSLLGARLLALSMASSLLFGGYYHYIAISPDHVAHLPLGGRQGLFRLTALLMALSQVVGVVVGAWGSRRRS